MGKIAKGVKKLGNLIGRGLDKIPIKYRRSAVALLLLLDCDNNSNKIPNHSRLEEVCQEYCIPADKIDISEKELLKIVNKYVGSKYGKHSQCGHMVNKIFRDVAKKKGAYMPPPKGNGIIKCAQTYNVWQNRFDDPDDLQPLDIFSSTGSSKLGHAGIYMGPGWVKNKKGNIFMTYIPDKKGKRIFFHQTSPRAGYITEDQLFRNRDLVSFCRHESLCGENDEVCE